MNATFSKNSITADCATSIIKKSIEKALEINRSMVIAIVDENGYNP